MKNCIIALTAALTLLVTSISAEERYLCEEEAVGGLRYDTTTTKWRGVNFNANDKYIISKPITGGMWEHRPFVITEVGESFPSGWCPLPFNENGYLSCEMYGEFIFNKDTMRFLNFYEFGYLDGIDDNNDNPSVAAGKCSPF